MASDFIVGLTGRRGEWPSGALWIGSTTTMDGHTSTRGLRWHIDNSVWWDRQDSQAGRSSLHPCGPIWAEQEPATDRGGGMPTRQDAT